MRIRVAVTGDEWSNREEVLSDIASIASCDQLIFEVNTEGPSLHALGFVDAVGPALARAGIRHQDVYIDQWHNPVEDIPFKRFRKPGLSHFFWMSNSYRHQVADTSLDTHACGIFIGRVTADRAAILYDVCHTPQYNALTSLMLNPTVPKDFELKLNAWSNEYDAQKILDWLAKDPVTSITGHAVRDQYQSTVDTNAELVKHYNRFGLEIVCETYCVGDAFFPTEKTVRPLAKSKPMVVYGPKGFLSRLRQLGFRTWHEIWDESYDELAGHERWKKIKMVLQRIVDESLWQHPEAQAIADENRLTLDRLIQHHQPS